MRPRQQQHQCLQQLVMEQDTTEAGAEAGAGVRAGAGAAAEGDLWWVSAWPKPVSSCGLLMVLTNLRFMPAPQGCWSSPLWASITLGFLGLCGLAVFTPRHGVFVCP